jgi:hypothetical protein
MAKMFPVYPFEKASGLIIVNVLLVIYILFILCWGAKVNQFHAFFQIKEGLKYTCLPFGGISLPLRLFYEAYPANIPPA